MAPRTASRSRKHLHRAMMKFRQVALNGNEDSRVTLAILEGQRGARILTQPISKIDAAQRQLDCAIRLFFGNEEPLAVYALSRAGLRVLLDLTKDADKNSFDGKLNELVNKHIGEWFNEVTNFLKHADFDPNNQLEWIHELESHLGLFVAISLYEGLANKHTPEMAGFTIWFKMMHPEKFTFPKGKDADSEGQFRKSLEFFKTSSHRDKLRLGKKLIKLCRDRKSWLDRSNTE
jgi:hypothetical protein